MIEADTEIAVMEMATEFLMEADTATQVRFLAWLLSRHYREVENVLAERAGKAVTSQHIKETLA